MGLSQPTRAALEWVRDDYEDLVRDADPRHLEAPSHGTRWTNRELLFHMWFGQRIARVMVPVMGGFSRLPAAVSHRYATALTWATAPYEWVNYAGSVAGARFAGLERARRWMARDTDWLLRWGEGASDADLGRGMSVPAGWDPYFQPWMSRAELLTWAPEHYRHHRRQLTLDRP
ncbi:DinB family protein [Intrasporangium chromatireducens]|uniref:DinB family protein n=1 Tax=Intrasporangium chromatireducens TaxID=1386088 RepID=UPI00138E3496|nr:DinB family protein [Intrasporangium chromatireducens]